MPQGQQHLRGIVDIGIPLVRELEIPAGGFHIGPLHRPVAFPPHLFRKQPVRAAGERRGGRHAGLPQRVGRDRRIPHHREAGLQQEPVAFVDLRPGELMLGLGAGIDYAMLIVSRFREQLADGSDVPHAAERANATSGTSVVAAGLIVMVALAAGSMVACPLASARIVAVSSTRKPASISAPANDAKASETISRPWPRSTLTMGLHPCAHLPSHRRRILPPRGGVRRGGWSRQVGVGGEELLVDLGDERGRRRRQEFVVALEIPGPVHEALATIVCLAQAVTLDHGAHGAIQDEDTFGQQGLKSGRQILHGENLSGGGRRGWGTGDFDLDYIPKPPRPNPAKPNDDQRREKAT